MNYRNVMIATFVLSLSLLGAVCQAQDDHLRAIDESINFVRKQTGQDVYLGGYSQGGMFAYQASAWRRSEGIASVITMGAPVDVHANMPGDIPLVITSEGDNGILFEGTKGRFFVNRGRLSGKPVEDLKNNPLPEGAVEEVYGGPVGENHTANFIAAMESRKQSISDVWSHNRMLETCHLANIAIRLGRELNWDPAKREIIGDEEANSFLSRENRKGFEIEM